MAHTLKNNVLTPDSGQVNTIERLRAGDSVIKKKVYIAGPMRGIPELNFPEFYRIEALWKENGWDVVNPAQMDKEHGFVPKKDQTYFPDLSIEQAMARDLPAVASCDAIALMTGWEKSQGANIELRYALENGKEVYCANTLLSVDWKPVR